MEADFCEELLASPVAVRQSTPVRVLAATGADLARFCHVISQVELDNARRSAHIGGMESTGRTAAEHVTGTGIPSGIDRHAASATRQAVTAPASTSLEGIMERKDRLGVFIRTDGRGHQWVARVRCAAGHGGNRQLAGPIPGGAYQCSGCGGMYPASQVRERQEHPGGENMAGGLYSVAGVEARR